jgi:hypothetical protein
MEDNLEKQVVPYMEFIVNQTLEMVESISDREDFDKGEVTELLYQLQEDFGEHINILSVKTRDRILKIHDKLLDLDGVYESTDL